MWTPAKCWGGPDRSRCRAQKQTQAQRVPRTAAHWERLCLRARGQRKRPGSLVLPRRWASAHLRLWPDISEVCSRDT